MTRLMVGVDSRGVYILCEKGLKAGRADCGSFLRKSLISRALEW